MPNQRPVVFRTRLHYGNPLFGYVLALALVAVSGTARLAWMQNGDVRAPFILFYPAVALASFLAGAGPGLLAVVVGALFSCLLFPTFPEPWSWIALAVLGPLVVAGFAHMRHIRDRHAAIARECARFRFISDHVSDWIFLAGEEGRIEYVNRTACSHLGFSEEELAGRAIDTLTPDWQRAGLNHLLERCRHGAVLPSEIAFERRDGSPLQVEVGCTAVRAGEDIVIHVAARDINERRHIEEKLREARRWESLGVLAGGLAHDFNTLLTSILGNASLVRDILPQGHPAGELIRSIEHAGDRSAELVRMMLATAGYRPRFSESLHLDAVLTGILSERPVAPNIYVRAQVQAADFKGDRRSLETLLGSLIANAAESYGESPGEVVVAIRAEPASHAEPGDFEEGGVSAAEPCLGIVVEDHGCGMQPEVLERAFDPFFTTKFMGRGLGLPAVRGIVRAYSGRLWVRSRPGEGTRVEVWLPAGR